MIKVYVYVVGLALLDPTADGVRVYFPDGQKHPDSICHGAVPDHETEATVNGENSAPLLDKARRGLRLTATGAAALNLQGATGIDLSTLVGKGVTVREDCASTISKNNVCQLSAMLTLSGGWASRAVEYCPSEKEETGALQPRPINEAPTLNFVNAFQAWNRRFTASDLPHATNAIEFSGLVEKGSLAETLGLSPEDLRLSLHDVEACKMATEEATQYPCVFLALKNGALKDDSFYRSLLGAADPHFAAYYSLLENQPPTLWLPVAVGAELCAPADGAGNPGGGCSPARTK